APRRSLRSLWSARFAFAAAVADGVEGDVHAGMRGDDKRRHEHNGGHRCEKRVLERSLHMRQVYTKKRPNGALVRDRERLWRCEAMNLHSRNECLRVFLPGCIAESLHEVGESDGVLRVVLPVSTLHDPRMGFQGVFPG